MQHFGTDLRMIEAWNEERKRGLEQADLMDSIPESLAELKVHAPEGAKDKALYQVGRLLVNWGGSLIHAGTS